ncbi:OB-fold domain-containing protein [Candidatus Latescibacterota bacterium]
MIVKIHGSLAGVEKDQALIEVNGITYGVLISKAVAAELLSTGAVGKEMTLHTLSYIEGNPGMGNLTPRLVGFPDKTDLDFFSMLTTVQGLGVKKALRALAIPVRDVARAIELNDIATLKNMPEIGGENCAEDYRGTPGKSNALCSY